MEERNHYTVCPPKPPLWHYPAIVLISAMMPGVFYVLVFVIGADIITEFQVTQQTRYILAGVGCLFGVATIVLFLCWEQNRWYWELTETTLIGGGFRKKKVYPLSNIVILVHGIPDTAWPAKSFLDTIRTLLSPVSAFDRAQAFLLMFQDGSLLPMHLHACEGGTRLMEELKVRVRDRVYQTWKLTDVEARALRMADWNRLVRPMKKGTTINR
jgi:hypothetical protein